MFWRGVVVGLMIASILAMAFVVYEGSHLQGTYKEMSSATLPALTRLVLGTPWKVGALLVSSATVIALIARRPSSFAPYVAALVLITAAMLMTWYGTWMPIWQVAAAIR